MKTADIDQAFRAAGYLLCDYFFAYRVAVTGRMTCEWIKPDRPVIPREHASVRPHRAEWLKLIGPDDRGCLRRRREELLAGRDSSIEFKIQTPNGEACWLHEVARPVWDDEAGRTIAFYGAGRDVTEGKRAEQALRESEEKFRALAETVPAATFIYRGAQLCYANPASEPITGYTREELYALPPWSVIHPSFRSIVRERNLAIQRGEPTVSRYEAKILTKQGEERWVDNSVSPLEYQGQPAVLATAFDITERKEAEALAHRRLEELAHMSRLSTMGEMATTLAHELNQPLGTIANYAEGCLTRIRKGAPSERALLDALEAITSEALRASGIIKRMRRFVSRREPEREALNVDDLVREVVELLDLAARAESIRIQCTSADSLPEASGDRVLVQQVILNLLRNSIEALVESQVADPVVGVHTSTNDERYIEIAVSDNGCGIPPDRLEGIFEAFFTTKREGMGMGLPISRSIVQAHGGRLWPRANPDRGVTFYFTLPPTQTEPGQAR